VAKVREQALASRTAREDLLSEWKLR
jgi:hypothetical protein